MAGVQDATLAVAVCDAGGLGSLPCALLGPEELRQQIELIQTQTSGPYNLNFFCHQSPQVHPQADAGWREALKHYFREYDIDSSKIAVGAGRLPFSTQSMQVISEFEPPVVSFHFGLPPREMVESIQSWGGKVLSSATTLDEALWLEDHGADGIIAQGWEAGGHRGHFLSDDLSLQTHTFTLLEVLSKQISRPIIAAGGIGAAEDVRRALNCGAGAVQVGTAFLLCDEAKTSRLHRKALQSELAGTTEVTNVFTGRPARGIVNRIVREVGPLSANAPAFPLAAGAVGALRKAAESQDSGDFSPLWCGENPGCDAIPAAQMVQRLTQAL